MLLFGIWCYFRKKQQEIHRMIALQGIRLRSMSNNQSAAPSIQDPSVISPNSTQSIAKPDDVEDLNETHSKTNEEHESSSSRYSFASTSSSESTDSSPPSGPENKTEEESKDINEGMAFVQNNENRASRDNHIEVNHTNHTNLSTNEQYNIFITLWPHIANGYNFDRRISQHSTISDITLPTIPDR